jgi:hypothetical protein
MKTLQFDFLHNPIPEKERMSAIVDSFNKAYVFLNEQMIRAKKIQEEAAHTHYGADPRKQCVLDFTLEITGDEAKFIRDALKEHYSRIY